MVCVVTAFPCGSSWLDNDFVIAPAGESPLGRCLRLDAPGSSEGSNSARKRNHRPAHDRGAW